MRRKRNAINDHTNPQGGQRIRVRW
jgi:hypothetical protein